jgi:hypothetical protein
VAFVFPASAAIMAMTANLVAAFSPAAIGTIIRELGADYAKLVALCAALAGVTGAIGSALIGGWLLGLVGSAVAVWGLLGLFLLIGGALRAHRADFDLLEGLDDAEERVLRERQRGWQKTLDHAYASLRSGLPAQGYRTIKDLVAREEESLDIYQWAFNRMLEWEDQSHALQFAERFAARLWDEGRKMSAVELAQQCKRLSPAFVLPEPLGTELAAYARGVGRDRLADELRAALPCSAELNRRARLP